MTRFKNIDIDIADSIITSGTVGIKHIPRAQLRLQNIGYSPGRSIQSPTKDTKPLQPDLPTLLARNFDEFDDEVVVMLTVIIISIIFLIFVDFKRFLHCLTIIAQKEIMLRCMILQSMLLSGRKLKESVQ